MTWFIYLNTVLNFNQNFADITFHSIHSEVKNVVWNEFFFFCGFYGWIYKIHIEFNYEFVYTGILENRPVWNYMVSCLFCSSFIKCHEKIVQWTIQSLILALNHLYSTCIIKLFCRKFINILMRDGKKEKTREIIEQVYYDIMCLFYEEKKINVDKEIYHWL